MELNVAEKISRARRAYQSFKITTPFRLQQLYNLQRMCQDNYDSILSCLRKDLNTVHPFHDIDYVIREVDSCIKCVKTWTTVQVVSNCMLTSERRTVCPKSLGIVLIVADYDYPLYLVLVSLSAAIAAGNSVIIRPSEVTPSANHAVAQLFSTYLDQDCYHMCLGDHMLDQLLMHRFDHICYMGLKETAQKVHSSVNRHLTSTTFMISGKIPVYLDSTVDLEDTARSIFEAKFCTDYSYMAPDFVLCNNEVRNSLVDVAPKILAQVCGAESRRMYSQVKFRRFKELLQSTKGKVVVGGDVDDSNKSVSPAIVIGVDPNDVLIVGDEKCGPILPIVTAITSYDAIHFILKNTPNPLVAYVFSNQRLVQVHMMQGICCGTMLINTTVPSFQGKPVPLAGVGTSGYGAINGKFAFENFTHQKSTVRYPTMQTTIKRHHELLLPMSIIIFTMLIGVIISYLFM